YFAIQVLELRENAILAINKLDYLEKKGIHVNAEILSKKLGVEVVLLSAIRGIGINQLLDRAIDYLEGRVKGKRLRIDYGVLEQFIEKVEKITGDRALAIRAIEGDELALSSLSAEKRGEIDKIVVEISKTHGNPEELITAHRYRFVEELIGSAVKEVEVKEERFGERVDRVFFSRFGFILSLLILFFALFVSFSINTGFPLNFILYSVGYDDFAELVETYSLVEMISAGFDEISRIIDENIPDSILKSLLVGGILPGVGAVASFFPLILILNYVISLVEDSGIMARVAVSMDRFFALFGLTGKSVFPFSISLACNVPGIATTRILETDSERIRVALASPFVICQARLLVIVLFVTALLASPMLQSLTIIAVYLLSVALFMLMTKTYGRFVKKESSELLIELPPYHFPSLRVSWWITWARSKAFIIKVGKLLLVFSIIMWLFDYIGLAAQIGAIIAKLFLPFGFESPELGFALLMGFLAKEIIISALAISFGTPNPSEILSNLALAPEQAIAMVIFIAFYTPCVATLS
ncbi:MAG: nucleoside recognition domain-containing protein, partial [Archaeoglobaceae archaeon]